MDEPRDDAVAIEQLPARFDELLARVERGDAVTLSRAGTPVARLVPVRPRSTPAAQHRLGG